MEALQINETMLRNYAVSVLASLSERKMKEFLILFADDNIIARMESDMAANDSNGKRYNNFREFMTEMEREDEV
ncbi:MAG: hypothetical protein IKN43_12740 [Selenomonadaceae bacterium]|nr:hypothetical protein [Selenomonadaceae bacterium]